MIYRVKRMTITDPWKGHVILEDGNDPIQDEVIPLPTERIRGDAFVFRKLAYSSFEVPKDAKFYIVVTDLKWVEKTKEYFYGHEMAILGRVSVEVQKKAKQTKAKAKVNLSKITGKEETIVYLIVVGLKPEELEKIEKMIDSEELSKIREENKRLNLENSQLSARVKSLEDELKKEKELATEFKAKYLRCSSAVNRLYGKLKSKLEEAEELVKRLKTKEKIRASDLAELEQVLSSRRFSMKLKAKGKEAEEKEVGKLKKEVKKIGG